MRLLRAVVAVIAARSVGFGWRIEEIGFGLPVLTFQSDGVIAAAAYLDPTTGDLVLQRRVPVEIEPRAHLPLIAR